MVEFLRTDPARRLNHLTHEQALRFRSQQFQQLRAWESEITCLAAALGGIPEAAGWRLLLEFPLLRLGRRAAREQTEDYALDLQDFHTASRHLNRKDKRQRFPALPGLALDPALHLHIGMRSIRSPHATAWVDAMLAGNAAQAHAMMVDDGTLPFRLTRDLADPRRALRQASRGSQRAGLVASSGAKRLRADGLGAELEHMDASAVAH